MTTALVNGPKTRPSIRTLAITVGLSAALAGVVAPWTAVPSAIGAEDASLAGYRTVQTALQTKIESTPATAAPVEQQPGWLGLLLESKDGNLLVTDVETGSPAEKAGIKIGDQVVSLDGKTPPAPAALLESLRIAGPGRNLSFVVLRGTKFLELAAVTAPRSKPLPIPGQSRGGRGGPTAGRAIMGVQVADAPSGVKGVKVERVTPDMPAAKAGLKDGDIIVRIADKAVGSPEELTAAMQGRRPGDEVAVRYLRGTAEAEAKVKLVGDPGIDFGRTGGSGRSPTGMTLFTKPVYKLAVVLVEFPDVKANAKIPVAEWEKSLFSTGEYFGKSSTGQDVHGSLNDYYRELSCGKLTVTGKVFPYVTLKKKRAEYGTDANRFAMLTEALDAVTARDGPAALRDFNGLFFVYAGQRQAAQRGGLFWPHRSTMMYKLQRWDYFICPEGGARMDSISVTAHEFGHMLGLPDLYARPETPGAEGLGVWCTMSTGHGRDGKPLHFSAWCKEMLGWLKPAVIDPAVPQKLILGPIVDSDRECYKVLVRKDGSEYLLLENRRRRGYDRDLPAEGLLIWRVVDGKVLLEESHGIAGPVGPEVQKQAVPFPSEANNAFTPDTTPSSKPVKAGGTTVHITDIRRLPDGRITFRIGYEFL